MVPQRIKVVRFKPSNTFEPGPKVFKKRRQSSKPHASTADVNAIRKIQPTVKLIEEILNRACKSLTQPYVDSSDRRYRNTVRNTLLNSLIEGTEGLRDEVGQGDGVDIFSKKSCQRTVQRIEQTLYDKYFHHNSARYFEKCRQIDFALNKNAKQLMLRFGPSTIAMLPTKQLAEGMNVNVWRNQQHSDRLHHARRPTSKRRTKGQFRCPNSKCRSWNTTYFSMQTRAADEPMTNFVACLDCNKRFKR